MSIAADLASREKTAPGTAKDAWEPDMNLPPLKRTHFIGDETIGELVRMASKGDERAWFHLNRRLGRMVLNVAKRTGLDESDAADASQLTWAHLMRHADQLRDPERVGAWLATTARRESLKIAIAVGRQVLSADPLEEYVPGETSDAGADAALLRHQYEPAIERALGRLPHVYRQLIQLLTSDSQLSYEEVANAMGLAVGSVGPMRLRCLQMLRRDPELRALLHLA